MRIYRRTLFFIIAIMSLCIAQTTISVLDFQANGISPTEASILTDRFRAELIQLKEYSVIERAAMQEILEEQGFQQSGCVTDECVVEVGQMLGAQQMVGGSIGRLGDVFTITARVIDVESGEILNVTTYDHEGDIGSLLKTGMRQVALDLFSKQEVASVSAVVNTGDLFVGTTPDGAELIVDNRKMGYTPMLIEKLGIGGHQIQLKVKGYLSQSHDITILTDRVDSLTIEMVSIAGLEKKANRYRSAKRKLLIGSISTAAAGFLFMALGNNTYDNYQTATDDADDLYKSVQLQRGIASASFVVGVSTAISACYYYLKQQSVSKRIKNNAE